jgi:hypothetical protein
MTLKSLTDPTVTDSTYTGTITLPALNDSDVILYRIKATDMSVAHNVAYKPATDYYTVTVESFGTVQDSYSNDFNTASSDFQGDNLFSITTATGFSDGAINTTHPYPIANPKDSISYTYQLKIPIKISATNPTMTFDEIALVEPNDAGSVFGGSGFYDYVVVEGSTNNGTTWKPFLTGYNCRAQSAWLTQWNSSNDGSQYHNSTGLGKPSLMVTRTINLTSNGNFKAGDQVVIRFRLLSDQLTSGWGWIIDNLKIQVDGTTTTTGVEPTVTDVTLYPNPVASEYLTISAPASLQGVLSLTSVQGQQLLSAPMQVGADGTQQVYVGNLSSGLYVVKIQSAKETVVRKIVVAK